MGRGHDGKVSGDALQMTQVVRIVDPNDFSCEGRAGFCLTDIWFTFNRDGGRVPRTSERRWVLGHICFLRAGTKCRVTEIIEMATSKLIQGMDKRKAAQPTFQKVVSGGWGPTCSGVSRERFGRGCFTSSARDAESLAISLNLKAQWHQIPVGRDTQLVFVPKSTAFQLTQCRRAGS